MAIQIQGNAGVAAEVDASPHRALRVSVRPNDIGSLGSYRLAIASGLTATIAAATATAGHVFAWRWGNSSNLAVLRYLSVEMVTIAGFTAAQEVGFDAIIARGYTASHTTQTAVVATGNNLKKRGSMATSLLTDARIAGAAALTAGTHTLDTQPMLQTQMAELAAAATVPKNRCKQEWDMSNSSDYPMIFTQDTGIVVRNTILMGAGGTVRFNVVIAWDEFPNANF